MWNYTWLLFRIHYNYNKLNLCYVCFGDFLYFCTKESKIGLKYADVHLIWLIYTINLIFSLILFLQHEHMHYTSLNFLPADQVDGVNNLKLFSKIKWLIELYVLDKARTRNEVFTKFPTVPPFVMNKSPCPILTRPKILSSDKYDKCFRLKNWLEISSEFWI